LKATLKTQADLYDLKKAVSERGEAIVAVKTREFWNDNSFPESAYHAIYITGAEVDLIGRVRGYFVNDTGRGEAARYVPAEEFEKSWDGLLVTIDGK
jgi:hypothetical protein